MTTNKLDGFFINLDRSPDRLAIMREELVRSGLGFVERFAAVDARVLERPAACAIPMAAYGAFLSHHALLSHAAPDSCTLIFEDDVQLADNLGGLLSAQSLAEMGKYDVVFLDCQPTLEIEPLTEFYRAMVDAMPDFQRTGLPSALRRRASAVGLYPARGFYRWGAAAYMVTPCGKEKLLPCLRRILDAGPPGTLDILYRNLIEDGTLDAVVMMPFFATPNLEGQRHSTIEGREQSLLPFALGSMIRRFFFAGSAEGMAEFLAAVLPQEFAQDGDELLAEMIRLTALGLMRDPRFLDFGV
jgi:glycosyl transferase family 25